MDTELAAVLAAGLLVGVAVVALVVIRGRVRLRLKGPFQTGVDIDGDPTNGVQLDRVHTGRDLKATGPSVDGRRLDIGRDGTFEASEHEEDDRPKG